MIRTSFPTRLSHSHSFISFTRGDELSLAKLARRGRMNEHFPRKCKQNLGEGYRGPLPKIMKSEPLARDGRLGGGGSARGADCLN